MIGLIGTLGIVVSDAAYPYAEPNSLSFLTCVQRYGNSVSLKSVSDLDQAGWQIAYLQLISPSCTVVVLL